MNDLTLFNDQALDLAWKAKSETGRPLSYEEWGEYMNNEDFLKGIYRGIRDSHIKHRGSPIITTEQLDILAELLKGKKTIDIGCGTGWLSEQLLDRGVALAAVDNYSEDYRFVPYADALNIDAFEVLENHDYAAVILSWPCYNTPFAYKVARALKAGTLLCYQGEGSGGCTGDEDFFVVLHQLFDEDETATEKLGKFQRSFWGIHDSWSIYTKR